MDPAGMTILDTAARVTAVERNMDYGHPRDNLGNTAAFWTAYLRRCRVIPEDGPDLDARNVAMMMVLVKISRDANIRTEDNLVDIAGWARCAEMLQEYGFPDPYAGPDTPLTGTEAREPST